MLMESILPINYYIRMIGINVDQKIFDKLLKIK